MTGLLANPAEQARHAAAFIRTELGRNRCLAALTAFVEADPVVAAMGDAERKDALSITTIALAADWLRRTGVEVDEQGVFAHAANVAFLALGRPVTVIERALQVQRFACARLSEMIDG